MVNSMMFNSGTMGLKVLVPAIVQVEKLPLPNVRTRHAIFRGWYLFVFANTLLGKPQRFVKEP